MAFLASQVAMRCSAVRLVISRPRVQHGQARRDWLERLPYAHVHQFAPRVGASVVAVAVGGARGRGWNVIQWESEPLKPLRSTSGSPLPPSREMWFNPNAQQFSSELTWGGSVTQRENKTDGQSSSFLAERSVQAKAVR